MVPIVSLWLPIVVSAVIVFVASSILHMVLPLHRNDIRKVPNEDAVIDAFRRLNIAPGDYGVPHPGGPAGMRSPEFIDKMTKGPLVLMTVSPGAPPSMAPNLATWFVYSITVSIFAAYIIGRALGPGVSYLQVFRFAGCTAFLAYSWALLQGSIWYRRAWGTTIRMMIDGLVYGLLTAGTFGWLWPR